MCCCCLITLCDEVWETVAVWCVSYGLQTYYKSFYIRRYNEENTVLPISVPDSDGLVILDKRPLQKHSNLYT